MNVQYALIQMKFTVDNYSVRKITYEKCRTCRVRFPDVSLAFEIESAGELKQVISNMCYNTR
jgi:hypothetical protein